MNMTVSDKSSESALHPRLHSNMKNKSLSNRSLSNNSALKSKSDAQNNAGKSAYHNS